MSGLIVHECGPACTVQDRGRIGYTDRGLSQGGAADLLALHEGAALLGQATDCAALEMGGMGGRFEAERDLRIALTGALMRAEIDGAPVAWNACHALARGQVLRIGGVQAGVYGYLHLGGGIATEPALGARACHRVAGLGRALAAGDVLPVGEDPGGPVGRALEAADRFRGGTLCIVASMQTALFPADVLERFTATAFTRGARANRMGVELVSDGEGFTAEGQLDIVSEVVLPGDIQMTGDGQPFVLMPDCQTTGGYPRIGTVLPCDLPRAAQAPQGAALRLRFVTLEEGLAAHRAFAAHLDRLPRALRPALRDPREMADLLRYNLVGGAISATDPEEDR